MSASESVRPRLYPEPFAVPAQALRAGSPKIVCRRIVILEAAADFLTSAFSILAVSWLDAGRHGARWSFTPRELEILSLAAGLLVVLLLDRDGAYRGGGSLLHIRETERVLRVPAQSLLLLLPLSLAFHPHLHWGIFLLALLLMPAVFLLQKQLFFRALRLLRPREHGVVIYGAGEAERRIISALLQSLRLGLQPVAVIDDESASARGCIAEMGYRPARSVPLRSGPISPALLKACRCNLLLVAKHNLSAKQFAAAKEAARQAGARIAFLCGAELQEPLHGQVWAESIDLDGLSILAPARPSEPRLYPSLKRAFDLVVSSLLLIAAAPLLLLIGLLVTLDSPGSALFVQKRVGRNGELFSMYKFRSMVTDAPRYQHSPVTSHDPRITRIGRLLRRLSLDELPQLINVFLGNMSLVGPRPEMPFIVQGYSAEHRQRLQVTPGITGLWQLSADRAFPIHESLEYDFYYIRNRGFFMDIAILIHTLFFAVRGGV